MAFFAANVQVLLSNMAYADDDEALLDADVSSNTMDSIWNS